MAWILLIDIAEVAHHLECGQKASLSILPEQEGKRIERNTEAVCSFRHQKGAWQRMDTTPSNSRNGVSPDGINRRKHPRVSIDSLISVVSLDDNCNQIAQSMGRALDVSQSGIQIETPHAMEPLDTGRVSLVTVDKRDKLVKTSGKLIYTRKTDKGMYTTGIKLNGLDTVNKRFVISLIKQYNYSKHASQVKVAA